RQIRRPVTHPMLVSLNRYQALAAVVATILVQSVSLETATAQAGRPGTESTATTQDSTKKPTTAKPHKSKSSSKSGGAKSDDTHRSNGVIPDSAEAAKHWPVRNAPAPGPGSVLPAKRIVAFYGNPLSKKMGVLGELPPAEMLAKLDRETAAWQKADPSLPVQPALHLIAVVAQGGPGRDGKYRLRMDSTLIEKVYGWAQQKHALLFLDVQVGQSTLQAEIPLLERFLKRPDVHLGI